MAAMRRRLRWAEVSKGRGVAGPSSDLSYPAPLLRSTAAGTFFPQQLGQPLPSLLLPLHAPQTARAPATSLPGAPRCAPPAGTRSPKRSLMWRRSGELLHRLCCRGCILVCRGLHCLLAVGRQSWCHMLPCTHNPIDLLPARPPSPPAGCVRRSTARRAWGSPSIWASPPAQRQTWAGLPPAWAAAASAAPRRCAATRRARACCRRSEWGGSIGVAGGDGSAGE